MADREDAENVEFKWGQKMGVDCKAQYYESFTYDGMKYRLYDCVYMYKEGVPEPFIGKLIGIWETVERIRQVNVHWFFRPSELPRFLGDITPLENEIFLATGKGVGLSNVNPLEAICGKCNVVCISKDSRNRQPFKEETEMADNIFYRTFNVRLCTISDEMGDEVGGLEVKYVFNNEESKIAIGLETPSSSKVEVVSKSIGCDGINKHFLPNSSNKGECMPGKSSHYTAGIDSNVLAVTNEQLQVHASSDKVTMGEIGNMKEGVINNDFGAEENLDMDDVHDRPKKKARLYNSAKSPVDKISSAAQNLVVEGEKSVTFASDWKRKSKSDGKDTLRLEKSVRFSKEIENSKDTPRRKKIVSLNATSSESLKKDDNHVEKTSGLVQDSLGLKTIATKEKDHDNARKHSKNTSSKVPVTLKNDREMKPKDIPRSEIDKGKWYSATDIIKDAFQTRCTAIMVLHNKTSNPHSGQALVKFDNSEITDRVYTQLSKGCLMLPNGRPLVCTAAPPFNSTEGQRSYFGHLVLDNIKLQGDSRDAVSTSHCSQPNTIEYEMAMEWCLLQTRFDRCWDTLYKEHDKNIRKLKVNLKSK